MRFVHDYSHWVRVQSENVIVSRYINFVIYVTCTPCIYDLRIYYTWFIHTLCEIIHLFCTFLHPWSNTPVVRIQIVVSLYDRLPMKYNRLEVLQRLLERDFKPNVRIFASSLAMKTRTKHDVRWKHARMEKKGEAAAAKGITCLSTDKVLVTVFRDFNGILWIDYFRDDRPCYKLPLVHG